ncbi:Uncharacterised protein [Mycobacteroides abscessus]|nr:Uncharacterised protein [Mycobacteroides abscessus]
MAEPLAERRAAGDGVREPATHGGAQRRVDEPVRDGVLEAQPERGAARGVERPGPGDGDLGRPVEDLALGAGPGLLLGGVVDLLEHARHGEQERRVERAEVRDEVLRVPGVREDRVRRDDDDLDEPGEHVRERQEEQGACAVGVEDLGEAGPAVEREVHEVAVGELDALGAPGRPGRVDDRREVVDALRGPTALDVRGRDVGPGGAQGVDGAVLDDEDVLQAGQAVAHGRDLGRVGGRLDDGEPDAGVRQDPVHLLGGRRLVDGDGHGTHGPGGEVEEGPLVAGARHDRDVVAGLDAAREEAAGDRHDVVLELLRGDALPRTVGGGAALDERRPGVARDTVGEEGADGRRGGDLDEARRRVFRHETLR